MYGFMDKISHNEPTYGTWITIAHPEVTEALSNLPFDWFVFDMEHAPLTIKDVELLMMPLRKTNIVPLVRVPWNDFVIIKQVLDIGAQGIIVPYINNKVEAINAVKAAKYPPEGIRGVGPRRSIMYGFDDIKEYYKEWNKKAIIIVQIETIDGLNNVDEILSVNGVSGIFIGPNDLSSALGIFREFNNVTYTNAINKILNAAKSANKIAGIMTYSPEDALDKTKKGFNFIALANDITHLIKGFKDTFKTLNIL
jgi:2-keto-3-deoxy-L-rhamnonate aldolase RhmA